MLNCQVTANSNVNHVQDPLFHALSSYKNLADYLDIDYEVQKLTAMADQTPPLPSTLSSNRFLFTCLRIESIYLDYVLKIFNYTKPYLSHYVPNSEKKMQVTIRHNLLRNHAPYFKQLFQGNLLTNSMNAHHPESSDFYLRPDIILKLRYFENGQIQCSAMSPKSFLMLNGICGGMRDWFICLYFRTLPYYVNKDPEIQLMSIAKLFQNGAPRQAEVLQLFEEIDQGIRDSILGFEIKPMQASSNEQDLLCITTLKEDKELSSQFLENLPIGNYSIRLSNDYNEGHALFYVKFNDNRGFLYDPNLGLIKLKENNQAEDLANKLLFCAKLLKYDGDYSAFKFRPVVPRDKDAYPEKSYTVCIEDFN
jgi:hypothetical protein